VEGASDPQRALDADVAGDGVKSGVAVELEILARIKDVEAADPEGDGGGENQNARVEGATNRDPGRGGRDAESEAKCDVRPTRKALGVGIKKQNGKRDRAKPERKAIQLSSGENEDRAGDDDENRDKGRREMAGRKRAAASAGIGGVDGGVSEAVESHRCGPGGEHGNYDPQKLMGGWKAGGGQHGSAKSKWEREDRVLPLDHFQGDAKVVEDGHGKIVKQNGCQLPVATYQKSLPEIVARNRCQKSLPEIKGPPDYARFR